MRISRLVILLGLLGTPGAAWAQCSSLNLSACPSPPFNNVLLQTINGATPGTVSNTSVASSNGFNGTVASSTSTPVITLTTTVTGLIKGNGTALLPASAGTDYVAPTGSGASLTGITLSQLDPTAPNGTIPIGNGSGFSVATLTAGANVSVTNGPGVITIAAAAQAPLSGATGSIGGSSLAAGACTSNTVAVTGATTAMAITATPVTYPGDGFYPFPYVSSAGVVTVKLCAVSAGTPAASVYNVRVFQ